MRLQHHGMIIGLQHHGMITTTGLQIIHNALKLVPSAMTRRKIIVLEVVVEEAFVIKIIGEDGDIVNQVLIGIKQQLIIGQQLQLKDHALHQEKSAGMEQ